ncbi:MAG: dicarboxylate/amino acid:cation symporter [Tissierellales bacterium]|nr:dicarboxylate/amino acid:cation symporter [Tissierellales bacterium]
MKGTKKLTRNIFIALIAGIIVGIIINKMPESKWLDEIFVGYGMAFIGDLFIRSIKMLVAPLVFFSIVCGSSSIGDMRKLGRVGGKTLGFYLTTTAIAITLAIGLASVLNPGIGLDLSNIVREQPTIKESVPITQVLLNMIPKNPIKALADGEMLQIIVFAILTGISISLLGEKAKAAKDVFESLNEMMLKMVGMVMYLAPIGVFGLLVKTFSQLGFDAMWNLGKYMGTVLIALFLHGILTYLGALKFLGRLSPIQFLKNFSPAMSVAFSTATSSGTLPVTTEMVEKRCGVSPEIASFTLPLGATINMDGTAIMQGVAVIFIAQVYGVTLTLPQIITVILTATLASVGTAGVPGVGLITLSMVLQSVNLPIEGIGLIMGIDRLLDMTRTAVNITGDAVCTLLIAKSENLFEEDTFYEKNVEFVAE